MKVRAKFWVSGIHHAHTHQPGEVYSTVTLAPAYGEANKEWSKATPQGQISLSITNPGAVAEFELGKHYYVDFTHADD